MQKACRQCTGSFGVTQDDLAFYEKVSPVFNGKKEVIPAPTLCSSCRVQRRAAFRNERMLYHRTCDFTSKSIITFYAPDATFKVYDRDAWWSDRWDAVSLGREPDLSRSFFVQLSDLRRVVPRLGMVMTQAENSPYSSYCTETKNCYMCVSCVVNEDSYYCYQANASKDCADCMSVTQCELCYECVSCFALHSCIHSKDCESSSNLSFCVDCRGCSDCIGCKNLVNKRYCIFNVQKTPAEYEAARASLHSFGGYGKLQREAEAFHRSLPTRAVHQAQCEGSSGDHLRQCRNSLECFDAMNLEDCRHIFPAPGLGMRDCRDCNYSPGSELVYESMSGMRCTRARFVLHSWDCDDITHTDECFSSRHLFGCIGLRHKEYCILNKQYTKEEYERLVPLIVDRMRKDSQWGEFPPMTDSPFAYNESIAQDWSPLSREQVTASGLRWRDAAGDAGTTGVSAVPATSLPDRIEEADNDVVQTAVLCQDTKKPFRIVQQELAFYRRMGLPLPHLHPEERYRQRLARKNPRHLWERPCMKCGKNMRTTYSPDRPEIVYCEECYLKTVY